MDWINKYKNKMMTADEAVAKYVKSGDHINFLKKSCTNSSSIRNRFFLIDIR